MPKTADRICEVTGLPVPNETTVSWIVVSEGWLAHSQHKSESAALAWIVWNVKPEDRAKYQAVRF